MYDNYYRIKYPLHVAIAEENTQQAKALIKLGVDVNQPDCDGFTPLDVAASLGLKSMAALLLSLPDIQVNLESAFSTKLSVYEVALFTGHEDIAKLVVAHPSFNGDSAAINSIIFNTNLAYQFLEENHVEKPYADTWVLLKLTGHRYDLYGEVHVSAPYYDTVSLTGLENNFTTSEIYQSLVTYIADQSSKIEVLPPILEHLVDTYALANDVSKSPEERYEVYLSLNEQLGKNTLLIPSGWSQHSICVVLHDTQLYICNRGYGSDQAHGIVEYEITHPEMITPALLDTLYDPFLQTKDFIMEEIYSSLGLIELNCFEMPIQVVGNCAWTSTEAGIYATLIAEYQDYDYSPEEAASLAYDFYQNWVEFDYSYGIDSVISQHQILEELQVYDCLLEKILDCHHDGSNPVEVQLALSILVELDDPESVFLKLEEPVFSDAVEHAVTEVIHLYDNSNVLIDYPYFYLNDFLSYFDLGFSDLDSKEYYKDVAMGQSWDHLLEEHPALFAQDTLKMEDVFCDQNALFSEAISVQAMVLSSSTHEFSDFIQLHLDLIPEFIESAVHF